MSLQLPQSVAGKAIVGMVLGAVSVLGFAPFYFYPLPVAALALLLYLWRQPNRRFAGFVLGFGFGMGLFGVGASWVYVSLHDFGAMPVVLAGIATLLFCAILALYPALAGTALVPMNNAPASKQLLLFPAVWVLLEWIRSWLFTGFPWLTLGYSQVPSSPLAGYAPLLGVFGVSYFCALSAGLLNVMFAKRKLKIGYALVLAAVWIGGFGLKHIDWTQPKGAAVEVSLLQGNIPQERKWREDELVNTLETYRRLVDESTGRLIVLPETALPLFYHDVPKIYLEKFAAHATKYGGDLLIGLPERTDQDHYYNSVFSFGSSPTQIYRKSHLVPFGEFIPLRPIFGWLLDVLQIPLLDFSRGSPEQLPLKVAGQQVAVNICYEDAFGEEVIRQLPQATLLANFSNDAWFGNSIAPIQHLQISQTRALESGRYMVRATNTGVTAVVNPRGEVQSRLPLFTTATLQDVVWGYSGATPYVIFGNHAVLLICVLAILAYLLHSRRLLSQAR
ncbi:MAG TPA: apolipoprotein N-acyltransferase [Burkholderiales bacterium]|nr:apolipoprotein N-acyltransferase [Burkholderiales bacterium]